LKNAGLSGKPRFLEFSRTAPEYHAKYCLDNCEAEQIKTGSEIVYGWVIWQDKKHSFIEAEFHAVFKKDSKLIDITPRVDGEKKVLFVEDSKRVPERIDNRTWRIWTNIKSQNGSIYETCQPKEMQNTGLTIDQKRSNRNSV
jgi:DNA-directed RNA polymerase subunit E'/Rpb7